MRMSGPALQPSLRAPPCGQSLVRAGLAACELARHSWVSGHLVGSVLLRRAGEAGREEARSGAFLRCCCLPALGAAAPLSSP
ncbi:hypothetical protein P7K49_016481 [Saguinus oedipus]|uniref:Uncharacterized protein n=1 Tax=Saguinus oedipus TaxID=9490 RepID=A0ABQ9VC50_SAGOE|nr:hypothetical protein P7K49_016481 [Saguinus oedipus]